MPTEDITVSSDRRAISALLFIAAGTNTMDVYSALNSSPWTAESFGGDPGKAATCREYVIHAMVVTSAYCVGSALIAKSWWPLIGSVIMNGYMYWLYDRALSRAQENNSQTWSDSGGKS
jgi:hypothetical protein